MKKQLQDFLSMNYGRLLFLAMIIFIGQGVAFSQGTITVTANTDDGAGSLRQAVRDAVDGDVIDFDGAITTITLDSSLLLGDKTLTIDGGGDVVLNRELVALDSFRLVTITGVMDKVVTIMDLTIQNGLAKGAGGGLLADHSAGGQTMLEGIIFKDNFTLGGSGDIGGGGARILGYNADTVSMAIDCEFIGNSTATGKDGGGAHAENATFLRCSFTGNAGDAAGGARSQNDVLFDHCTFTNNTADDDGGAIRISTGSGTALNCTFEGNAAGDNGGAIFMARGSILNCKFYNNTSGNLGGAVFGNNNSFIINTLMSGNSSVNDGGGVCIDDEGIVENCIITGNTAGVTGGGVWFKGGGDVGNLIGSVVAYNTADSIGGGVHVQTGNVINCVITKNYSADNGGALSGDGTWLLANSIIYDNDAAGDAKNIHFVSNGAPTAAQNCAIDATAYDAAAWTASNITTLDASPFVGGSEADSLMLPYSSPLIDAGSTDAAIIDLLPATALNGVNRIINSVVDLGAYERLQSFVVTSAADEGAGSLRQIISDAVDGESIITFADDITTILVDTTLVLGDKTLIIDGGGDIILDGAFNADPLLDTLRVIEITGDSGKVVTIKNLTIQNGFAEDDNGGGISARHNSTKGKTILENIIFKDNTATLYGGGLFIYGLEGDGCMVTNCEFTGNKALDVSNGRGAASYAYHTIFSGCTFTDNAAGDGAGGLFMNTEVEVYDSHFSGNTAGDDGGAARLQGDFTVVSNCTFENNSADDSGGAIFMAHGNVYDSEIINNSSTGQGGGISSNNDGNVYNSLISGNTSAAEAGGIYIDDTGILSNCIVTNNTATGNAGGVFAEGNNGPALVVGSVIANNSTDASGGGIYVQAGDVVNCIVTANYAGTNGGAITGETGPWFIGNSIVWDNDAAGADKNIEVVSNSATDHAANSAIDATAYNDTWTATNITILNASPFVGGTEADSLYSLPTSGLIDKGTTDFGIAALLPEFDLDGNDRIQGTIDIGVYETEIIGVLGVSLNVSSLEVSVGGTGTLVATVEPAEAGNKTITWSSSDEGVATVADGVVTGVADGSATITATTVDGGFTATADVTVFTAVTGVTLDQTAVTLEVDQTVTLVATVEPATATNQTVGWVSGNEDVATVDGGLVTAIAPGTASISAITMDGSFIALCQVTVTEPTVAVTGVTLDQTSLALEPGDSETLVATVAPAEATDPSVTWSTSDAAVATVADGVVTAVADGTATITVTTTDGGFTATCDVTVETVGIEDHATGFRLYPNPVSGGKFFIEVSDPGIKAFEIYNVLGVVVHQEKVSIQKNYEMNTEAMKSGIYFIRMIKDESISVDQFIVE